MTTITIHHGDCLTIMPTLQEASIDAIVTDPPYGLGFMGKQWDRGVPGTEYWSACLRVAKPGAHLLAFGGTRTYHRLAAAVEDAGWEIRDCIAWLYGSGFPKSLNLDGRWDGWGTALKPAMEPIVVARKPLFGTVAENVATHGVGALNIDGCRIDAKGDHLGGGRISSSAEGWDLPWKHDANAIESAKNRGCVSVQRAERLGRWPANVIHDGSDEVVGLFPGDDDKSAARFFYCAKASKADRDDGCDGLPVGQVGHGNLGASMERFDTKGRNVHPTVKPTDLMRYLCRLVTPPGGVVMDPFMGSGSTGRGAVMGGFGFVGIELDPEYTEISRRRIAQVSSLWNGSGT